MRGVLSSLAVLYILAGLLLIQVLATPEATPNAANSQTLDIREIVRRLGKPSTGDSPPVFTVEEDASRITGAQADVAVRAAYHIADAAAEARWEPAPHVERHHIAERDLEGSMRLERDQVSTEPVAKDQNAEPTTSSLVLRSAAPKVFGVNIYLIIAWLALMYLMYRTGSF